MPPRRLYEPSPAIPPGLDRADWLAMLDALGREVARIATMGADPQARFPGVGRTSRLAHAAAGLDALWGLDDATAAAADLAGQRIVDALGAAGEKVLAAQDEHAALSVHDLVDFMRDAGMPIAADPGVAAAAAARTKTAMLHDWEALEERTRAAVRDGVRGAALSGGGVASVVAAITEAGAMSWARAVLIARTEMADLYDSARFATMRAPENAAVFSGGWWWRARPDACAICQALHGEVFDVGTDPQRHHQCRCIVVPYTAAAPPPPHRSADDIAAQLPASWPRLDTREDYRRLVGLRDNRRWRPSHTMRHPDRVAGHPTWAAGPKPRPPAPMGKKHARPPLEVKPAPWQDVARREYGPPMSAAARAEAAAVKRAEADALRHRAEALTRDNERIAADVARNEARPGRRDYEANRTRLGYEKWQNDNELAGINVRATQLENAAKLIDDHGYDPVVVAAARRAVEGRFTITDGSVSFLDASLDLHPDWKTEDDVRAYCEALRDSYLDSVDLLPPPIRGRLNVDNVTITLHNRMRRDYPDQHQGAAAAVNTGAAPVLFANPRGFDARTPRAAEAQGRYIADAWRAMPDGLDGTWVHETGHTLDHLTEDESAALYREAAALAGSRGDIGMDQGRAVGDARTVADLSRFASGYGATNGRELVAETFMDFVMGTADESNPVTRLVIDRMGWRRE